MDQRGAQRLMFGRRKREEEAAREAERKALFAELAKRPDTVCPFLGLAEARTEYRPGVTDDHRCYAFGDPAELSAEQQHKVCLQRGYGNCPRYLRGVLVIPTEELEALRRPQALPPPPLPEPEPAPAGGGGGRRAVVVLALVLVLAVAGGGGAFYALNYTDLVARETPSVTPPPSVAETMLPTASGEPSPTSTTTATPSPTPNIVPEPSGEALPTPGPNDTFSNHAVVVFPGTYPVYELAEDGAVIGTDRTIFDDRSSAPVERVVDDGTSYWRTLEGTYINLAYVAGFSGDFEIYEIWVSPEDELRFRQLDEDEL